MITRLKNHKTLGTFRFRSITLFICIIIAIVLSGCGKNTASVSESNSLGFDVTFYDYFRNDSTGKWRHALISENNDIQDYALDYYKAYFKSDDEIHVIYNFSRKTANCLTVSGSILNISVTDYVKGEEHDAKIACSGASLGKYNIDINTGEEITATTNENAGVVSNDDLITAVKNSIEGAVAEDEKIADVSFDGKNLTISIDLSGADTSLLSAELIAESRISSITDDILALDDKFYNTWETVTVDFGSVGAVTFNKSQVKDEGFGKFFDIPIGIFN